MSRRPSLLVALVVLVSCASLSAAQDVRAAIEAGNKAFSAAVARGDAAAVAALYTSTAQALPPGSGPLHGREAIQKAFEGMMAGGVRDVTLTTQEVEAHGDTAHEVGTWAVKGNDGAVLDSGKYIVIWKNEGGQWRLHRDIWNSNTAPAAR